MMREFCFSGPLLVFQAPYTHQWCDTMSSNSTLLPPGGRRSLFPGMGWNKLHNFQWWEQDYEVILGEWRFDWFNIDSVEEALQEGNEFLFDSFFFSKCMKDVISRSACLVWTREMIAVHICFLRSKHEVIQMS